MSIFNCGSGLPLPLSVSGEQTADLVRRAMSNHHFMHGQFGTECLVNTPCKEFPSYPQGVSQESVRNALLEAEIRRLTLDRTKERPLITRQAKALDNFQRVGVVDPGMTHKLPGNGHSYTVTDPEHTHSLIDPGHVHTFWEVVYDRFGNAVPGIRSTYHTKAPFVPAPVAPTQPATATAVAPSTAKPPLPARALTGRPMQIGIFVR